MPRSGVIGEQIYDQVEKLVADGMNRTQAFAEISKQSGRQAGTVAANYYRVARKRAGQLQGDSWASVERRVQKARDGIDERFTRIDARAMRRAWEPVWGLEPGASD